MACCWYIFFSRITNFQISKSFTGVIKPLSTPLIKPNFHVSLSHWCRTTISLKTRNLLVAFSLHSNDTQLKCWIPFYYILCVDISVIKPWIKMIPVKWYGIISLSEMISYHSMTSYHFTEWNDIISLHGFELSNQIDCNNLVRPIRLHVIF